MPEPKVIAERSCHECHWILSYDIPEIRTLFSDHFILAVESASGMNTEKNSSSRTLNKEVLNTNSAPPRSLIVQTERTTAEPPPPASLTK